MDLQEYYDTILFFATLLHDNVVAQNRAKLVQKTSEIEGQGFFLSRGWDERNLMIFISSTVRIDVRVCYTDQGPITTILGRELRNSAITRDFSILYRGSDRAEVTVKNYVTLVRPHSDEIPPKDLGWLLNLLKEMTKE